MVKAFVSITALCLLCLCGCKSDKDSAESFKSVFITTPEGIGGNGEMSFTGVVKEEHNINLGFKTPGQISQIFVKEGEHVKNGQLLAVLDDKDYKLGVEALQIQYDQLKDEVERTKRLVEKKSVTANDYEKAVAGLKQLAVQLQVNKNKLAYTRLYAPTSGIIENVNFSPAEMVDAGTCVFSMLTDGSLEVVCDIPVKLYLERDNIVGITGRPAQSQSEPIKLKLLSIVPKADSNQLYRMRLGLPSGIKGVSPGMNLSIDVTLSDDVESIIRIPASSVYRKGDDTFVWLLSSDSTVTARKIILDGSLMGSDVRVKSGLGLSDTIVRAGVSMLHEGEKVVVIEKASKTNVGDLL